MEPQNGCNLTELEGKLAFERERYQDVVDKMLSVFMKMRINKDGSAWSINAGMSVRIAVCAVFAALLLCSTALAADLQFVGAGRRLVVYEKSVVRKSVNGAPHLYFRGLMNFSERMEGDHRSLVADFDIDCAKRMVDMPRIVYFYWTNARGRIVDRSNDNAGNWLPLGHEDDVVAQAASALCKK